VKKTSSIILLYPPHKIGWYLCFLISLSSRPWTFMLFWEQTY
jgi:hypothetical protein